MITIDGSKGEGGGQILRTSLALSLLTGQPVTFENIRAGRRKPGLMRQHLTAVRAAAAVGGADVSGAEIGAQQLVFRPGSVTPGDYEFAVGTAGSATLVLQTVLPALLTASGPSSLVLEGGTHNPYSPPFDFLERAFAPLVNRMGPRLEVALQRPGFYPAGGGRFTAQITPAKELQGFDLLERGEIRQRRAMARVANIPRSIAEREIKILAKKLGWDDDCLTVEEVQGPRGPGNIVVVELASDPVTEVFCGFGERGVRAEAVARKVIQDVRRYLSSDVPVGIHLADQLLLLLALSSGGRFRTFKLSRHCTTQAELLERFLGTSIVVEELPGKVRTVTVTPR